MGDRKESSTMPWAWIRKLNQMVQNEELEFRIEKSLPAEISPWLYISDESNSLDKEKLQKLEITHVLSMNRVPNYRDRFITDFYQTQGIVHLRIKAEDEEDYGLIEKHWAECLDFIKLAREKERCKIVVNCLAGINRSVLVSVAAYMIMENKNVLDAVKHCIDKRGRILSNKSFQKELCMFSREQGLLGEKPEGLSDEPIQNIDIPPPPIIRSVEPGRYRRDVSETRNLPA
mmetsp:Transcript_35854/g.70531  ORF Transcript_35854/g.70531 Transcript_35854/m.70531 type:complete len:231 (-) Transcript_35854:350-1042(-)